jgi:uncharacterized membrane protein YhfC
MNRAELGAWFMLVISTIHGLGHGALQAWLQGATGLIAIVLFGISFWGKK